MKLKKTKIIVLIVIVTLLTGYGSASILDDIYSKEETKATQGTLTFLDKQLNITPPLYFVTGRLFVPLFEVVKEMGGMVTETDDGYTIHFKQATFQMKKDNDELLYRQIHFEDDKPYIYIYDLAHICNLAVVFNSKENKVSFYYYQPPTQSATNTANLKDAYLRLEDVTADYGISGNFTDEKLEKLRVMSDYMSSKGQSCYIAWIPLYTNPPKQIQNDLTKDFNFYNAGFLYTLDYIVNHKGNIVLHGLTHQEKDTVSAIGAEFGVHTPFSKKEIGKRMAQAKQIAETLGFEEDIFEFPHYASTAKQVKIAENYFDVLYQQSPYARTLGRVEHVNKWPRKVTFIPTPLGYVNSIDEFDDTLNKIDELKDKQVASLFMHPYLDYDKISCITENGFRNFNYDESAIIPRLISKMTEKGFTFSQFDIK